MTHCLVNHHITGHVMFVLVSVEWVMTCPATDNSASCEIRALIHFHHATNMSAAEICRELYAAIYGQNVMIEGNERQLYYGHICHFLGLIFIKILELYVSWVIDIWKPINKCLFVPPYYLSLVSWQFSCKENNSNWYLASEFAYMISDN
jgi:hypothetical protein